jgi:hypothetical protein
MEFTRHTIEEVLYGVMELPSTAKLGGRIGLKFYRAVLKRILGDLVRALLRN